MENLSSQSNLLPSIQLYPSRWVMILLFGINSGMCYYQNFQFTIIANIVQSYYGVSSMQVKLSGMVFMIYFILFFIPATLLVEKTTLKTIMLLTAGLDALGNVLKLVGTSPGGFYIIMISQSICSMAEIFVLIIPTKVASVWFGAEEVSTACALAMFGGQIGFALGSVIPTMMVKVSVDQNLVRADLNRMLLYNAVVSIIIMVLVVAFFKSKPPTPPSQSQIDLQAVTEEAEEYWPTIKRLARNKDFLVVLFSIEVNFSFYSVSGIMLNEIWTTYFPDEKSDKALGIVNFVSLISGGCFGSILFGHILDKTHAFKSVTFIVLVSNLIATACEAFFLLTSNKIGTYISVPTAGFFSGSLMVIAYEYSTEITYPIPETVGAGILNVIGFTFSLSFIVILSAIFHSVGHVAGFVVMIVGMGIGTFTLLLRNPELKRRDANIRETDKQTAATYGS